MSLDHLRLQRARRHIERFHRRAARFRRQGTAAVEFAILAPIFFILIFGMIEYGRMVMVHQILTNAAREGARVATLSDTTTTKVTTAANSYLTAANISGSTIAMTVSNRRLPEDNAFRMRRSRARARMANSFRRHEFGSSI